MSHDEGTGLPLNADGTVTVYHHTSATKAAQIKASGILRSAGEPHVYVTTQQKTDTGYGDTAVTLHVNPSILMLDDEFPDGRQDFRISVGKPGGAIKVKVGQMGLAESLRLELTQIFSEGMVRVPVEEIRSWVDSHFQEIKAKLSETLAQGYNTSIDDYIKITNPYTNEPMEVSLEIQKSVLSMNSGGSLLRFDIQNSRILISAVNFVKEYKNNLKDGLISGIIHELTHAIDPGVANKKKKYTPGSYDDIVNSDIETVAFNREYIDRIKHMPPANQEKILDRIRKGKSIGVKDIDDYYSSLTPKNKTKFINQLYKELH